MNKKEFIKKLKRLKKLTLQEKLSYIEKEELLKLQKEILPC